LIHFKDIVLGQATAELEGTYYPELLLKGFLDPWNVVNEAIKGHKFLFLGYKGSGKSAIGEHLRLSADSNPDLFVKNVFLSDFPYGDFERVVTGNAEPESRYPSAWSWILMLYLLDSFSNDLGATFDENFSYSVELLKEIGLLPATSLKKTVIISSKPKYKAKLPFLLNVEYDGNKKKINDLSFLKIIDHLKNILSTFKTKNKHFLIIDGLDDILLQEKIQYKSIAALILEVTRLNIQLFQQRIPAKIIVFCRTELYERLPGPNKNKTRQDLSIELDWYHNPHKPSSSKLVHLVNNRAKLSDPELRDIFLKFFPREINNQPLLTYFLHHTRHTPRDFIQLLHHIQECCSRREIEINQIIAGVSRYSSIYFLPEIKDELVGYAGREEAEMLLKTLAVMKKKFFSLKEISESCQRTTILKKHDLYVLLEMLFDCSAIGNIKKFNGQSYYSFKYRNRHSYFNSEETITLHRGLWKGMNIR
jgi:hypothetical protein